MWAGSVSITRELVRDVNSQTSPRPTASVGWHPAMCANELSRWPWCTLKFENHWVGVGTVLPPTGWARGQSRYQLLLVQLCHLLGLAGMKPGACLTLPPFCKPVPWGFGRSGACPLFLSQAAQTSHMRSTTAMLPTSLCLNPSHASSSVARPSDPQLDAARAVGEGRAKQRWRGSGASVSPEDW